MRIESIEIQNFRQYRKEKFEFPKLKGKKDIHVIIGENGEGKTNILNALTWCLYGEELHLGDKNTAINKINSQYVQELRDRSQKNGETKVTVVMSIEDGGKITFMRTAIYSITQSNVVETKQDVIAIANTNSGNKIIDNKDDYEMYVSRYVPKEINEYIFFDGELMDQYFKSEKRGNIESGIKDLTKATTIERTKKQLNSYAKTNIAPVLKNNGDNRVSEAQANLESEQKRRDDQQEKVGLILSQIKKAEDEIEKLTEKIQGFDTLKDKTDRLEELEEESDNLKRNQKKLNEDLNEFVRQNYINFALFPALNEFRNYIHSQESKGNLPPKIDKRLVQSIIDSKECAICGSHLNTEHLQHVLSILQKLEVSSKTSAELNRASSALNAIIDNMKVYPKKKQAIIDRKKTLDSQVRRNEEEYEKLSKELRSIPNQDKIREAIIEREEYRKNIGPLHEKFGREKLLLEARAKAVKRAESELDDAMKSNRLLDKYRKQLDFCKKGIILLDETLNEIIEECRKEMEVVTFEIFNKLIWKKDAFSKVNILDDYSFELLDAYGQQTLGACSAAERAFLALSFTIALQQTSGHDSLLYIDTPLGRVGEKNRINFTEVLTGIAESKQVILSFTPTEYDDNVRRLFANEYSSYCELSFDKGVTTIKK
jgi:DNA sulfur modification protein DndD